MKKILSLIFTFTLLISNVFSATLEMDNMEYANDGAAQAAYVTNGDVTNEITTNPSFETWTGGDTSAPDGWTLTNSTIAKESSIVKVGTYSAKLTNGGNLKQDISVAKGIAYWKGKTVTVGMWVWSATPETVYARVQDAVNAVNSSAHTGNSTWQWLTASLIINSSASTVDAVCWVVGAGTVAYFDGAVAIEGENFYNLQSYSEATIKTQGSYSLKGVAAATDSLNKTLTKTFAVNSNLTGVKNLRLDVYALRTGSNFKIGLHDTGGTTTEITPNIATSNTWQPVNWDWSGVSDANKDNINTLTLTITNADSANTIYLDYHEIAQAIDVFGWVN